MVHTVLITAHPKLLSVSRSALSYCHSIVEQGGRINQIFFMHDANYFAVHPSAQQWSVFAAAHNIALQTCVSTAEQKLIHLRDYAAGFQQGGLSSLADSILSSDYFMQFNIDFDNADVPKKPRLGSNTKIVFIFSSSPSDDSIAAEGIDLLLVLSAFEADISVVFQGDGVLNISQVNEDLRPRYTKRFRALADFDVDQLYILGGTTQKTDINYEVLSDVDFQQLVQESHALYF